LLNAFNKIFTMRHFSCPNCFNYVGASISSMAVISIGTL